MYNDQNVPKKYLNALRKMSKLSPRQPVELVAELGGVQLYAPGKPIFTGWKGFIPGVSELDGIYSETADLTDMGWVAQWYLFNTATKLIRYVNLPGMERGTIERGNSFDIGTERVRIGDRPEQLDGFVRAGFEKLQQLLAEDADGIQ